MFCILQIWHEPCFNLKWKQIASNFNRGGFMKNLTVDEFLTQVFRETAEKSGWNIYRKGRKWVPLVKRRKLVTKVKSFN